MNLSNNVQNVCRACLAKSGSFQSIFIRHEGSDMPSLSFAEIIMSTSTSVYIALNDGLPDVICLDCSNKLLEFYQFKLKFERNDLVLRSDVNLAQDKDACQIMIKQENESLNNDVTFVEMNEKNLCDEIEEQGPFRIDDENNISEDDEDDSQPLSLIKGVQIIKQEDLDLDYDLCKIEDNNLLEEQNEPFRINDIKNEADEDIRESEKPHSNPKIIKQNRKKLGNFVNKMSQERSCTPPNIREVANNSLCSLIPEKSRHLYKKQFKKFEDWRRENKIEFISENVLLAYFEMQRKNYTSSSLWTMYSMIRCCLNVFKNIDISKFYKLQAVLKRTSTGYIPKKSKIFESDDINKFINTADDNIYLAMKVILIIGYNGACRREDLTNMSVDDVEFKSDCIIVFIPKRKNNIPRKFVITDNNWIKLIRNYNNLRPKNVSSKRFFLTYRNGYCINCPIGINFMGRVSRDIASYLKLPNPECFTGHCFRRSSATHLANCGGDNKVEVSRLFNSEENVASSSSASSTITSFREDRGIGIVSDDSSS